MADENKDTRKVEFVFRVTPAELRNIANILENNQRVSVNWYHTRITFENEQPTVARAGPEEIKVER